jgi:hypothetical protein
LAAGANCTLVEVFSPTSGGSYKDSIGFSSSDQVSGQTITLSGILPTITGAATLVYGTHPTYTLTASPDNTYTVSITGTATSSASVTVSGGSGTFSLPALGVGSYTLSVTDGNGNVATESITVTPAVLTLSVSGTPSRIYGQPNPVFAYNIAGFISPDTATSATTGTASLTTAAIPKSPAGSYIITVGQGTLTAANYTFTETNGSLTVNGGAAQTILFPALANYTHGTTVPLVVMTTSGLPVTYTTTGPASVSNSVLSITGTGAVTVTAAQAGNSNFGAATSVTRNFTAQ